VRCLFICCQLDSALKLFTRDRAMNWAQRPKVPATTRTFPVNDLRLLTTGSSHAEAAKELQASNERAGTQIENTGAGSPCPREFVRALTDCFTSCNLLLIPSILPDKCRRRHGASRMLAQNREGPVPRPCIEHLAVPFVRRVDLRCTSMVGREKALLTWEPPTAFSRSRHIKSRR